MTAITGAEGDIQGTVRTSNTSISSDLDEVLQAYDFYFDPLVPTTDQRLRDALAQFPERENSAPPAVQPWECRIGLSKFQIPPTSINVSKVFKTGSMTGATIRHESSAKFNSGHTETQVQMTLIFASYEQIWGFDEGVFSIDFDNDPDEKIDGFASSLRGLIAQFRYMPILPLRNDYLNKAHNITAVGMSDLSISTLEEYPHAVAATLTLLKFNHRVYMPMIDHLDQGVHFGRARQMFGRAAWKLTNESKPVVDFGRTGEMNRTTLDDVDYSPSIRTAEDVLSDYYADGVPKEHMYTRHSYQQARSIDFYYPFHSPTDVHLPSIEEIRLEGSEFEEEGRSWWERMLGILNFDTSLEGNEYDRIRRFAESQGYTRGRNSEYATLRDWLETNNQSIEFMSSGVLDEYKTQRLNELGIEDGTNQAEELKSEIDTSWLVAMYNRMMEDPSFARALAFDRQQGRDMAIREWEIPMVKLNLDPSVVHIDSVAVNRGNKFAPLQLQMEDEPTYQHIGGKDATVEIQLTIEGSNADEELVKLRTMFETVSGLARLHHGYGALGFLGVSNIISSLAGIRYVMPLQFDVETIPDYPQAYAVTIVLTDFDVFQQKREMLSLRQQAELVEAFGKRNPFLRIKQLWGAFSSAPDLPLTVRDDDGAIVGHLDPDFYFRRFSTIDDDLTEYNNPDLNQSDDTVGGPPSSRSNYGEPTPSSAPSGHDDGVHVALGRYEDADEFLTLSSGSMSLSSNNETLLNQGRFHDASAADLHREPFVEGLSPASRYMQPNFSGDDPSSQFHAMIQDEKYRDQKGRMVRAFPTYMLWLIDEGGDVAGVKMFDNFYGLQSVLDFSIVQSEDILGDTLVLRISNAYSRLSTQMQEYVDSDRFGGRIINEFTQSLQRTLTGMHEYLADLDSIVLQPGLRVHMRLGYSSNPNRLETVFNGTITDVQYGEVMTVTCQSDAIELGTIVNGTDKEQTTGSHDGCFEYNTPVRTWDGNTISIGHIVNKQLSPTLLGVDNKGNPIPCEITNWFKNGRKDEWLDLEIGYKSNNKRYGNINLRCTVNHHILVNGEYRRADKAVAGDEVVCAYRDASDGVAHMMRSALLGDGSVNWNGRNCTFAESHCEAQEEYGKYVQYWLGDLAQETYYRMGGWNTLQAQHNALTCVTATELRAEWYPDGEKRVPQDLSWMDDFAVAKWYMDDGSLTKSGGAQFSTDGFIKEDVERLASKLDEMYQTTSKVKYSGKGTGWYIRVNTGRKKGNNQFKYDSSGSIERFWNAIAPHVVPPMRYKLPHEYRDVAYIDRPRGEWCNRTASAQIIDISPVEISNSNLKEFPNGRTGYDIETTAHNYCANGVMVHNSLVGLYMSEPRDLMLSLLTQGTSTTREWVAHMTRGRIFSENRFGIKHFGTILYEPMNQAEHAKVEQRAAKLTEEMSQSQSFGNSVGMVASLVSFSTVELTQSLWENLQARRDLEVFKRNIYPGNGIGIGQYAGGDLGDIGLYNAMDGAEMLTPSTGINIDEVDGPVYEAGRNPRQVIRDAINEEGLANSLPDKDAQDTDFWVLPTYGDLYTQTGMSDVVANLFRYLGITPGDTEDDEMVDEVSFRANTYMKTVWDLFLLCAALLPDYIVAVRPFEHRSTIFYGKPHWLYTSGVVPVTSGVVPDDGPQTVEPDEEAERIRKKIKQEVESRDNVETFDNMFSEIARRSHEGKYFLSSPNTSSEEGGSGPLPSLDDTETGEDVEAGVATTARAARSAGMSGEHLIKMVAIAGAESRFNPDNVGDQSLTDSTWGPSIGLWQVRSMKSQRGTGNPRDAEQLSDPAFNAWAAQQIFQDQGYRAWSVTHGTAQSNNNHYTRFMDRARQAVQTTSGPVGGPPSSRSGDTDSNTDVEPLPSLDQTETGDDVTLAEHIFQNGWKEQGIPVNASASGDENVNDPVGEAAARLYSDHRHEDYADEIWNNFREYFTADSEDVRETFKSAPSVDNLSEDEAESVADEVLEDLVEEFKRFCWQNAAARGWIVRVADRRQDVAETVLSNAGSSIGLPFLGDFLSGVGSISALPISAGITLGGAVGEAIFGDDENDEPESSAGAIEDNDDVADFITQILGGGDRNSETGFLYDWIVDQSDMRLWNFGAVYDAFGAFLAGGSAATLQYMREESNPGRDQGGLMSRAAETLGAGASAVLDTTTQIFDALGTVFTSVISNIRLNMFQLSQGMSMSAQETYRSSIINKVHNDSLYYTAGIDNEGNIENRLLNYVDNPFTRELGEPVVEIREPFQRMHTIGSFQDIISDNITANSSGVPTVVTATSNSKHPVTVHFDKAAPAHFQRETQIDTGLRWDKPEGWLDSVTSPMDTLRQIITGLGIGRASDGVGGEVSAKRVASWQLKQHLKDIYSGELIVVGDESIRPHDLIYIADVYEGLSGFVECEQVVHHFTPETGFITSITPNAVVTVNDPARFSFTSHWRGQKNIQQVRNHIRQSLNVPATSVSENESLDIGSVLNQVEDHLENSLQFTGGKSALISSIVSAMGSGTLSDASGAGLALGAGATGLLFSGGIPYAIAWKGWQWVRDNLLDQNAAYINYLTHKGQPLDAGLSQTHLSNAVGMQHGFSIIAAGMRLGPIPVLGPDDSPVIRTSDVVQRIQWNEFGPNDAAQEVSMFIEQTKKRVHQLSNIEPEGAPDLEDEIYLGTVSSVVDGKTLEFTVSSQVPHDDLDYNSGTMGGSVMQVQLAGVQVPEDPLRDDRSLRDFTSPYPGTHASHYTTQELEGQTVALRVVVDAGRVDDEGNIQAYVFHNAPEELSGSDRNEFLVEAAGGWPHVSWDSYMDNGQPYTFNWQMVADGYGTVNVEDLRPEVR